MTRFCPPGAHGPDLWVECCNTTPCMVVGYIEEEHLPRLEGRGLPETSRRWLFQMMTLPSSDWGFKNDKAEKQEWNNPGISNSSYKGKEAWEQGKWLAGASDTMFTRQALIEGAEIILARLSKKTLIQRHRGLENHWKGFVRSFYADF